MTLLEFGFVIENYMSDVKMDYFIMGFTQLNRTHLYTYVRIKPTDKRLLMLA